ncbi:MAG: hypothetical protein AB8B65_18810 [Kordia sp.]|uniref:hypothetical protein n=1 Tax=Kordia sp. TaxID=1965332 RepID=UPI00385F7C99
MSNTHSKATFYFKSYQDYFWQWESDQMFHGTANSQNFEAEFNCITIPNGMTIAYKQQIAEVLPLFAEKGFPPFGALILVFLATNSGEVSVAIKEIFDEILAAHKKAPENKHIDFDAAYAFLKTLLILPLAYKKGKNRTDLFAFLFETTNHSLSPKFSNEILDLIQNHGYLLKISSLKGKMCLTNLSKDINALALLHHKYPTVDVLLKAWLKIEEIPVEPEDADIEYFSEDPDFIQELIEEPKTFFMGSLIKRLWSGIQLPMHYAHPGEMPLGGISDVTNKGKFDNMLISEFANDDLIFLHRIANKEALFIRRETTPEEDLRTRIFLIDTTIKNWGTPKILSFATAFSFIHHPKNEMQFQPYALGETYEPLYFDTKDKIISGLQRTSPLLDASQAIEKFIDECEEENIEITLFTSAKTLEHQNIRRLFNMHHTKFGGVITADSQGNIDVYKMKTGAKRLSKHIQLPLQELWANPPKNGKKKSEKPEKNAEHIANYPLLYGYPTRILIHFSDRKYAYILQKNGDLFRTTSSSKGFKMIQRDIRFVTGIKQEKLAVLHDDELMILFWNVENQIVVKSKNSSCRFGYNMLEYKKALFKDFIVFEDEFYLITRKHYSDAPVFMQLDIYDGTYLQIGNPSTELKNTHKAYIKNRIEQFDGSIFTKINTITITKDLEIIFNYKHRLDLIGDTGYFENIDKEEAHLEDEYSVSLHKRNQRVEFDDNSVITIDKNGIITFESGDPNLPTFYLASYIGVGIGISTHEEYAGSYYFKPEDNSFHTISVYDFDEKYMEPFLQHILDACT